MTKSIRKYSFEIFVSALIVIAFVAIVVFIGIPVDELQ